MLVGVPKEIKDNEFTGSFYDKTGALNYTQTFIF